MRKGYTYPKYIIVFINKYIFYKLDINNKNKIINVIKRHKPKAIFNLVDSILMSGRINHYTMVLDPKQLYQIKNHYLKIYRAAINNLVYYMPADVSDCLVCQKNKRLIKGQILV